jgi:predicted GNAT superfamily acetyltransferase
MSTIDITGDDDHRSAADLPDNVTIRALDSADEMADLGAVFQQVWGSVTQLMSVEILMAVSHAGGYVSAAYEARGDGERMLGASVGLLARHRGTTALHSHITGLLPGAQRSGLGRAMKMHQRAWAADHDIEWIVWTFDPLVRRNAHFNIDVLGAEVHEYLPRFYGTMSDSINAGDESDRLLMAWRVDADVPRPVTVTDAHILVPTPEDVVSLRRTDPGAVSRWRTETRAALQGALDRGDRIVGFTPDGEYVIEPT